MTVSLIILASLIVVGTILYMHHKLTGGDQVEPTTIPEPVVTDSEECCGMHLVCEKDSLLAAVSSDIVYYDDEELDAYAGRGADEYNDTEIEQFRDVLLTLIPEDIAGWARSLQLRKIELPSAIKDELLLIVSERRLN